MKRRVGLKPAEKLVVTALEESCPVCGARLEISQHRERWIQRLDRYVHLVRRDKSCRAEGCPGPRRVYHAREDLRLALPYRVFGLDVALAIGERHLRGESLGAVQRDLNARGIPIDQRHKSRVFRDFLALAEVAAGDDAARRAKLRAQGGIVLMCDGVQFDDRSPVLYLAWDAISGTPLFGERKTFRGEDDLRPILERVRAMDVPVIAIVSDKEKGLVPAVQAVFPDTPYQLCQTHFLKNCARPLEEDASALGVSVERRATRVHKIAKRLHDEEGATAGASEAPLSDAAVAQEVCRLARQNARVSGKAPLDPPELKRHERLEELRSLVTDACERGAAPRPRGKKASSRTSGTRSLRAGTTRGARGA